VQNVLWAVWEITKQSCIMEGDKYNIILFFMVVVFRIRRYLLSLCHYYTWRHFQYTAYKSTLPHSIWLDMFCLVTYDFWKPSFNQRMSDDCNSISFLVTFILQKLTKDSRKYSSFWCLYHNRRSNTVYYYKI